MNWQQQEFSNSNHLNQTTNFKPFHYAQKPIEIYVFLDPFSRDSYFLKNYLSKMTMEYGRFFTMRPIISGTFCLAEQKHELNRNVPDSFNKDLPTSQPFLTYFAIKAAELQGKKAGYKYLEKLQEKLFFNKINISSEESLFECAREANLDIEEFARDFFSTSAKKAYQCDRRLTQEMDVTTMPTIVFFNQAEETHGIKVSGIYSYDVYELILSEMLTFKPIPSEKPRLKDYLTTHSMVSTEEIAIVYDIPESQAEKEMKKLQLKQIVEKCASEYDTFWKLLS